MHLFPFPRKSVINFFATLLLRKVVSVSYWKLTPINGISTSEIRFKKEETNF
jgi:hypothetical protein